MRRTKVDKDNIIVKMKNLVERNIDKFLNEYEFLRQTNGVSTFVFKKRNTTGIDYEKR